MKTLAEIEVDIHRLAGRIGAPEQALPTYGHTADGARPHIESNAHGYHYVVVERGQELRRDTTNDLDELLYHVFASVSFGLACDYELAHRVAGQDFRRLLFARQLGLLASLSPAWAERKSRAHQQILQQYPFDDC